MAVNSLAVVGSDVRKDPRLMRIVARGAVHLVIAVICLIWVLPVVGLAVTSFRTPQDASTSGWWTIFSNLANLRFDSYFQAITDGGLPQGIANSLLITIPSNIALVAFSTLGGYVFGVMKFRGRNALFLVVICMMAMPPQLTLAPLFRLFIQMGIAGTYPALWIYQAGFTMPLGILILKNFFSALPKDIFEAAEVDGASPARMFLSIAVPVSWPGIFSVLILHFIFSWNDLLAPLVFVGGGAKASIVVQIAGLATSTSNDNQSLVAASSLIGLIIPLIVFFALQRYFVKGFLSGSVKG